MIQIPITTLYNALTDMNRRFFLQKLLAGLGSGLCARMLPSTLPQSAEAAENWDFSRSRLKEPQSGKTQTRWAMAVFVEKLSAPGLMETITSVCHMAHNVPDIPNKDPQAADKSVKWIWKESFDRTFYGSNLEAVPPDIRRQNCLVACNHCDNAPCVRVCPTGATYKAQGGLVMMDYHRCIGCRYCMAACPYGARSFNYYNPRPFISRINPAYPTRMRGVVEKCSFCAERLAVGLPPHCVAASGGALVFGNRNDPESEIAIALEGSVALERKPTLGAGPNIYYIIG